MRLKGQISLNFGYHVNFKDFLYQTFCVFSQIKIEKSKREGKDQELIQSSTTPDLGYQWESETSQTRAKSPFQAGDHILNILFILLLGWDLGVLGGGIKNFSLGIRDDILVC